jgi:hypothetical protein
MPPRFLGVIAANRRFAPELQQKAGNFDPNLGQFAVRKTGAAASQLALAAACGFNYVSH